VYSLYTRTNHWLRSIVKVIDSHLYKSSSIRMWLIIVDIRKGITDGHIQALSGNVHNIAKHLLICLFALDLLLTVIADRYRLCLNVANHLNVQCVVLCSPICCVQYSFVVRYSILVKRNAIMCAVLLTVVQQNGCCNKCQQNIWPADSVFMCGPYRLRYRTWSARSVSH